MNGLFEAALEFQVYAQSRKWRFCFIGGLAVLRWGEPRMTRDIDAALWCGFGQERTCVEGLLEGFRPRVTEARTFALANRVVLLFASNGVGVDVSLAGLDFEDAMVERATSFEFAAGCSLVTCSAEDLVILKSFADRSGDWTDVEGIVLRQGRRLDGALILKGLGPLCAAKDAPWIPDRVKRLLEQAL